MDDLEFFRRTVEQVKEDEERDQRIKSGELTDDDIEYIARRASGRDE